MKIKLLLGLALTLFITLPTTCNAEEGPNIKWEDLTINESANKQYFRDNIYNINNNILSVHNSSSDKENYIRLYNASGEKEWEYDLGDKHGSNFLINNEYLGIVEYNEDDQIRKEYISLLDLKTRKISKQIDITKVVNELDRDTYVTYSGYHNNEIILLFFCFSTNSYQFFSIDLDGNIKKYQKFLQKAKEI